MTMNYNAAQQQYSEVAQSRLLIAVSLVDPEGNVLKTLAGVELKNVSYWDQLTGGQISRTITPRKRPGQTKVAKVPGMHLNIAAITLTRAWNQKQEHRQPLEPLIRTWLHSGAPVTDVLVKVEQYVVQSDGSIKPHDMYIGPISSYDPPKGNSEGDQMVQEILGVDPEGYDLLEPTTPIPTPTLQSV